MKPAGQIDKEQAIWLAPADQVPGSHSLQPSCVAVALRLGALDPSSQVD